jgi:hypothetical protein
VIEERIEVGPPAPQERDLFVDVAVRERSGPGPTEVVERQELPSVVVGLVDELVAAELGLVRPLLSIGAGVTD